MRSYRKLIIILLCMLLMSCASTRASMGLQQGKRSFQAGDYKSAFHQLLPLAAQCCNPQAEYAVGYMYYYGYGTARDAESGIFWMNKAAERGYPFAIQALKQIHQQRAYAAQQAISAVEPSSSSRSESNMERPSGPVAPHVRAQDEVLQSINKEHAMRAVKFEPTKAGKYALQLFGAYVVADVKSFRKELQLSDTRIWRTQHNGKDWYVLTYGDFASIMSAKLAQDKLPHKLNALGAWVKKVEGLESIA